jgi:ATP-dependent Lhr-like helicase
MRKVLCENTVYPYLSFHARAKLIKARKLAKAMKIGKDIFVSLTHDASQTERHDAFSFALFPWMGSRGMRTLLLILQNPKFCESLNILSLSRENDWLVKITSGLPIPRFKKMLAQILKRHVTHESLYSLIDPAEIPLSGTYDLYLPDHALVKQYAASMLDVEELSQFTSLNFPE